MAKHAEKKATENAIYWSGQLKILLAVINFTYMVSLLYSMMYNKDYEWSYWTIIWPFFYAYLEYKAYLMLIG